MSRTPFFTAPHRVMFAGGSVQVLIVMLFWACELSGRYLQTAVPTWPWPPTWLHAGLMLFGVFPWFVFGFLMTALPKWMGAEPLRMLDYTRPFWLLASGWCLFYASLALPPAMPFGLLLVAAGWVDGTFVLWRKTVSSLADRRHAFAVVLELGAGVLGLGVYAWALIESNAFAYRVAVELGLWGCLVPIFFTILHRMLPVFTGAVIRPYQAYQPRWALWAMLAALAAHGLLRVLGLAAWCWLPDAVAACVAWHLSARWGLKASLKVPMLAMLHLGMLWLGMAMTLYALQGFLLAFGVVWGGLIPLHALGIGFFGSILIGMATRVTRGHSGRPIGEDRWALPLFMALQGIVFLRLAGEFVGPLTVVAALGWLIVFGLWASVHLPMYFRPRPDGQPG